MNDLISRQAAIETLIKPQSNETHDDYWEGKVAQYNFDVIALQQMPSAEPERKKGRWELIWIKHRDYTSDKRSPMAKLSAYCTECRAIAPELKKRPKGDSKYRTICNVFKFCPNCGAEMEQEERK